jgi:hypothetical protein
MRDHGAQVVEHREALTRAAPASLLKDFAQMLNTWCTSCLVNR